MNSRGDAGDGGPGPVERRASARAPATGLEVEGVDRGPLKGMRIPVAELGPNSFFVPGSEVVGCVKGAQYRLKLHYRTRTVVCTTECVRIENAPRVGVVFRLLSDERSAIALLQEVLRPPRV